MEDLHRHGLRCTLIIRSNGFDINDFYLLVANLVVSEDEWDILRHPFLTNNHTLTALHDEISANIFGTFSHLTRCFLRCIRQQTEVTTDHHGNTANLNMGKCPARYRHGRFATCERRLLKSICRNNIGINRCRVRHIPQPRIIRIHRCNCPIILKDSGLANLNVCELYTYFHLAGRRSARLSSSSLQKWSSRLCRGICIICTLYANTNGCTCCSGGCTSRTG